MAEGAQRVGGLGVQVRKVEARTWNGVEFYVWVLSAFRVLRG